ncbi:MAG TPA: SRPBCC family protein [Prosthecobacter sp.]
MPLPAPIESPLSERELVLVRETDVPAAKLYAGWTQPDLVVQWFTPKPWSTVSSDMDLRPGGRSNTTMRSPEGQDFPNKGVFLEVVPNEKIVFTDAYFENWEPNPNPFFTGIVTFETLPNGKTRYTARARHWTKENCEKHAAMGFMEGWGAAFDQLVELMSK